MVIMGVIGGLCGWKFEGSKHKKDLMRRLGAEQQVTQEESRKLSAKCAQSRAIIADEQALMTILRSQRTLSSALCELRASGTVLREAVEDVRRYKQGLERCGPIDTWRRSIERRSPVSY